MSASLEFLEKFRNEPVLFVEEVLQATPDEWQAKVLSAYGRGERLLSIRSGHGVGKTTVAAWCLIHHMLTRFPQKSVCTAPTSSQLYDALFSEVRAWISNLPPVLRELVDSISDRISLREAPHESFISAKTSRIEQPDALQGVHSKHVMLVVDEAAAIPETIYEAAYSSMTSPESCVILLGNPTRGQGFFYDTFHRLNKDWHNLQVSCFDSPRVSQDFIKEMGERYGEDSNVYRTRVLGEFPISEDDTLISLDLVQSAILRDIEVSPSSTVVWGLDVARHGADASALCKRKGNTVLEPIRLWRKLDLMELCGAIVEEYKKTPSDLIPDEICVDAIGMGSGVCDRLRELDLPAIGINVAESPSMSTIYTNKRAELWVRAKEWLEARDCRIPDDKRLLGDLIAPRYTFASNGKLKLESKDDMKKRKIASPDAGDAFCLTMHNINPISWGGKTNTRTALRREIRGIV